MPAASLDAWREVQEVLRKLNRELQAAVRSFPPERAEAPLGTESSAYIQFAGIPQHDLYHAGQVALLKKGLAASSGGSGRATR